MNERIYVCWSSDGQHIRKWSREPFQGGQPFDAVPASTTPATDSASTLDDVLQGAFLTCTSGGGRYVVSLQYRSIEPMQRAHASLVEMQARKRPAVTLQDKLKQVAWGGLAADLVQRLPLEGWVDEQDVTRTLTVPNMRIFAAIQSGMVERRRTWFRRRWMIRRTVA